MSFSSAFLEDCVSAEQAITTFISDKSSAVSFIFNASNQGALSLSVSGIPAAIFSTF
jgi:hypothetical protein